MNITFQDIQVIGNVRSALDYNRFPELKKYKDRIDALKVNTILDAFVADPAAQNYLAGNGTLVRKQSEEVAAQAEPYLREYLDLATEIYKDLRGSKKEYTPLGEYVYAVKAHLQNSLSDHEDAMDPLMTETDGLQLTLLSSIKRIPTEWQLQRASHNDLTTKVFDYLYSSARIFSHKNYMRDQLSGNPSFADDNSYLLSQVTGLTETKDLADDIARSLNNESLTTMFRLTRPEEEQDQNDRFTALLGDPKHGCAAVSEECRSLIDGNAKGMPQEVAFFLREVSACIRRAKSDAMVSDPEQVAGTAAELLQEMNDIQNICSEKLQNGFTSQAERKSFVESFSDRVAALGKRIEHYENFDAITDMDGAKDRDKPRLEAGKTLIDSAARSFSVDHGLTKRAERLGSEYRIQKTLTDRGLADRIDSFYEMMKDTKSGWSGHKNSKEYNNMLESIEKARQIYKKSEELSDVERLALQVHLKNVEKTCKLYLSDKTTERKTETGKDRFAGALGILEVLNFDEAEKIRQQANTVRKKQVKFSDLQDRAQEKAVKRKHLHDAAEKQADKTRSKSN